VSGQTGTPAENPAASVWFFLTPLLMIAEIETDFFSVGALYKKKEPFGTYLLTSIHAREYFRKFAIGDVLRRAIYCLLIYALPITVMAGTSGLMFGLATFAVLQLFTWVMRHIHSMILLMVMLMGAVALSLLLPGIAVAFEGGVIMWILGTLSFLVAMIFVVLSLSSTKSAGEDCYYDK